MQPALIGHQVRQDWMGTKVLTLADLVPTGEVRAVVVGINPAPPSVEVGHYYQGRLGQQFYARLRQAGLPEPKDGSWEDDQALSAGIGFTDIIKRPTRAADDLHPEEFQHGRQRLLDHLSDLGAPMVLFTFKKTAEILLGRFSGHGLLDQPVGGSRAFVMPGPYEKAEKVAAALSRLEGLMGGAGA